MGSHQILHCCKFNEIVYCEEERRKSGFFCNLLFFIIIIIIIIIIINLKKRTHLHCIITIKLLKIHDLPTVR